MHKFVRRVCAASAVALGFAWLLSVSAAAANPDVLTACVNNGNGMMRLVPASEACHANETRSTWNSEKSCSTYGPTLDSLLWISSSSPVGTSSGLISVSRTDRSTVLTASSN